MISVVVYQDYYADANANGLARDLRFQSSDESSRLLKQYGIKPKYNEAGFALYRVKGPNNDGILIKANIELDFSIYCADPFIRTHTVIPDMVGKTIVYTNQELDSPGDALTQTYTDRISAADQMQFIASLKLVISPGIFNGENTSNYSIKWRVSSLRWKYYYIGKQNFPAPEIEHEEISFGRQEILRDNSIYQEDTLAKNLFDNFPEAQHWVFTSNESVVWKSEPYKEIKLLRDSEVIISHLPNPRKGNNGNHIINALNN